MPKLIRVVPAGLGNRGVEHGQIVQIVLLGDRLTMAKNFGAARIMIHWHVIKLIQQRQVIVAHNITGSARISVPIPRASYIGTTLHDANTL